MKDLNINIKKVDWRTAEACVNAKLIELGYQTFLPFNDGGEIDIIAVKDDKLHKIQVKSVSPTNDKYVTFYLRRSRNNYKKNISFSYENIDLFILYDGTYFYKLSFDQLKERKCFTLRYISTNNQQSLKVNMAYDYLINDSL